MGKRSVHQSVVAWSSRDNAGNYDATSNVVNVRGPKMPTTVAVSFVPVLPVLPVRRARLLDCNWLLVVVTLKVRQHARHLRRGARRMPLGCVASTCVDALAPASARPLAVAVFFFLLVLRMMTGFLRGLTCRPHCGDRNRARKGRGKGAGRAQKGRGKGAERARKGRGKGGALMRPPDNNETTATRPPDNYDTTTTQLRYWFLI